MRRYSDAFPQSRPHPSFTRSLKRELLLYVEDDDDNWDVAELCLGESFELLRAKDDREACRLVREHHQDIDAILMDIELRGSELNGAELTELMRGKPSLKARSIPAYARGLPTISKPILFVTAQGARYTDVQLMLFGADLVVAKPLDFAALQVLLRDLVTTRARAR